jgi:hypothetical protein
MNRYSVELTDTYSGEANYSWVRRATITVATDTRRAIMRAAKKRMQMSGSRGVTREIDDLLEFRPFGECIVLFVTHVDDQELTL